MAWSSIRRRSCTRYSTGSWWRWWQSGSQRAASMPCSETLLQAFGGLLLSRSTSLLATSSCQFAAASFLSLFALHRPPYHFPLLSVFSPSRILWDELQHSILIWRNHHHQLGEASKFAVYFTKLTSLALPCSLLELRWDICRRKIFWGRSNSRGARSSPASSKYKSFWSTSFSQFAAARHPSSRRSENIGTVCTFWASSDCVTVALAAVTNSTGSCW